MVEIERVRGSHAYRVAFFLHFWLDSIFRGRSLA